MAIIVQYTQIITKIGYLFSSSQTISNAEFMF